MTRLKLKHTFILIAFFSISNVFAGNGAWELQKNESGIKVYTRSVEGEDLEEFKAITTISAPRKKLVQYILNVNDYPNWYPDITNAKILKKINDNQFYMYYTLDLPWPVSDRDVVSKMTIKKSGNVTTVKLKSTAGIKAEDPDYVRIKNSYGTWTFTTIGANTKVQFQFFANPAGSVPDWVINMFIVDNPFETFKKLKEKAKK